MNFPNFKVKAVVAATAAALAFGASAHTNSIGYTNSGSGSVTFWYGNWHQGTTFTEGSMELTGVNGTSYATTTTQFTLVQNTTPTGLQPGVNYFTSNGTALIPYDTNIETSYSWQGATITGLSAGTYQFTYIPISNPTADWDPMDSVILSSIVTLTGDIVGGSSVRESVEAMRNTPAYAAASVIDQNQALADLFSAINGDEEISNAVTQTLPLLVGGSQLANSAALSGVSKIIQARISSNRGLSSGDDTPPEKFFWFKPFGSAADQKDDGGVTGFKIRTAGFVAGMDKAVTPRLRLGSAFAFADGNISGNSSASYQRSDVKIHQLIGYGSYTLDERTEANFQIGFGGNKNKSERSIPFASVTARSEFNSLTAYIGGGVGRIYKLSEKSSVTPSVRLDYSWMKDSGYSEVDAGLLNLNVQSRRTEEMLMSADVKATHNISEESMLIANIGFGYDVLNKPVAITAAYAGAAGSPFSTTGVQRDPWVGRLGFGFIQRSRSGFEFSAQYDFEARSKFKNQTLSAKARWSF